MNGIASLTVTHAWGTQGADDLVGALLQAPAVADLVGDLVEPDDLDPRHQRLLRAALEVPEDPDEDLGGLDDGDGFGPFLLVGGQAVVELPLLARILAVSADAGEPVMSLAAWVVNLPCAPCRSCVTRAASEVRRAAELRRAVAVTSDLLRRLAEGDPAAVERALELTGATT